MIRVFRHYIPSWLVVLAIVEATLLFLAAYLGVSVRLGAFDPSDKLIVGQLWPRALFWTTVMFLMLTGVGLYQPDLRDDLKGIWFRLAVAFVVGTVLAAIILALVPYWSVGEGALWGVALASVVLVGGGRSILHLLSDSTFRRRRILVVGAGDEAAEVEKLRRKSDWRGLTLVGFVHIDNEDIRVTTKPVYPHDDTLAQICTRLSIDEIVVAVDEDRHRLPVRQILDCKVRGVQTTDVIGFFEQRTGKIKVDALKPSQVIFSDGFVQAALKSYSHRAFDIVVSISMLTSLSWLMLLTAILIRIESKRGEPILYRQVRVGRDNKNFEILKFRSMTTDAEKDGIKWATKNDNRVTKVGSFIRKTRIDELPQLINVLRGDMSFVGPRPERPEFVRQFEDKISLLQPPAPSESWHHWMGANLLPLRRVRQRCEGETAI